MSGLITLWFRQSGDSLAGLFDHARSGQVGEVAARVHFEQLPGIRTGGNGSFGGSLEGDGGGFFYE